MRRHLTTFSTIPTTSDRVCYQTGIGNEYHIYDVDVDVLNEHVGGQTVP